MSILPSKFKFDLERQVIQNSPKIITLDVQGTSICRLLSVVSKKNLMKSNDQE